MSAREEVALATNAFLDAFLQLGEGRDDDELVFVDGALRTLAEHLGIAADWPEIEPMTAAEFRRRFRAGKAKLARGDGP